MYEPRTQPLAPPAVFRVRLARNGALAIAFLGGALAVGVAGYHFLVGLEWVDSLLNASMILGGMGPVDAIRTSAGKIFASAYALFSGVVIVGASAVVIAPFYHRFLHRFHGAED